MTKEEIMKAVNEGNDLVLQAYDGDYQEEWMNAANAIVCAIGVALDNPDKEVSMLDVLHDSFDGSDGQWLNEFPGCFVDPDADEPKLKERAGV